MFGKLRSLFGSKAKPPPAAGPQLAMPLFDAVHPCDPAAVVEHWSRLFPVQDALRIEEQNESVTSFAVGERTVMAAHIPMPVPNDEVVAAVRSSWMWQKPDTVVRAHRAHAIVTAARSSGPVEEAWDVARVSAAILHASSGVGLYWGSSRQVHVPEVVAGLAAEETPPIPLWVGITISGGSKEGPFSATTHGLEALGHKEFEVRGADMGIGDLRTTLTDLALYVVQNGPVLEHGQTFGPSEDVAWSIRHTPSKLVPGRDVILLGIS